MSNVRSLPPRYAGVMENTGNEASKVFAPLVERFGHRLACLRDGLSVSWSLDGQVAAVVSRADGSVGVTFSDAPTRDACRSVPASATYRSHDPGYVLANHGVSRMVDDLLAFFAGTREPRFVFVGIEDRVD